MGSRGYSADSNSFSGISQPWHISKRQNTPPLQQASVSPLIFLWHISWFSKMQFVARRVGGVIHWEATSWVKMFRSEPVTRIFLCLSAVRHLFNIREAGLCGQDFFLSGINSDKIQGCLLNFLFFFFFFNPALRGSIWIIVNWVK